MRKTAKRMVALVVALIVAVAAVVAWRVVASAQADAQDQPITRDYPVTKGDITAGVNGQGTVRLNGVPQKYADMVTLGELFVKPGQTVNAGDKLATVDVNKLNEALATARDELEKAKVLLEQAKDAKALGELNDKKNGATADTTAADTAAQITQAEAQVDSLRRTISGLESQIAQVDSQLSGLEQSDPGRQELTGRRDSLQAQLDAARSQLEGAQASLSSVKDAKAKQDEARRTQNRLDQQIADANSRNLAHAVDQAIIDRDAAQRKLDQLQAVADHPDLTASQAGTVLSLDAKVGDEVGPETAVVTLGDPGHRQVVVQIPQSEIGKVREGQDVEFTLDAFGDRKFTGRVTSRSLTPVKDSNPVAYEVLVTIDASDAEILQGMTANVTLIVKQKKGVVQVSNKAISTRDGEQWAKLKNSDGGWAETRITTGFSDGKVSEIVDGLKDGDTVVVEG
ncbi:MAG: efflux RND transporter periplasmic adaptor subunit [Propionibacteriaceae bacterium]|nr:efflux RND transporter periplasmic adaptor subunit [Propionibacteriaceae bacterium]